MFLKCGDPTSLGCRGGCRCIGGGGGGSGEREGEREEYRGKKVKVDYWRRFSTTASGIGGMLLMGRYTQLFGNAKWECGAAER